jgi:hypothetical protein
LPLLLFSGCKSVEENIDARSLELNTYTSELTADPSTLPVIELDWETALSMIESNLVMRDAAETIIKAEVGVRRVFWDLVPQLTLQGIYTEAVKDITELASDNFNLNVNALFSVPGFLRLRMDYYAAILTTYAARQQYELTYREEVINLYSLFRQHQHMQAKRVVESLQAAEPTFSGADRRELEFSQRQREREHWLMLSAALGCYTNQWRVKAGNLPTFDYSARQPQWSNKESIGRLFTNLEAAELEAARLKELGIKFEYWPQLTMRLYSPSVYLVSGGDRGGFEFDADDIRFEASVRMKLDTNLAVRDRLREAKRDAKLLRQKLYEDAQERTKKLMDAHAALHIVEERKAQAMARRKLLNALPQSSVYDVFEQSLGERVELLNDLIAIEQEYDKIIPLLWIADEARWQVEQIPN